MEIFILVLFVIALLIDIIGVIITLIITIQQDEYYKHYMITLENDDRLISLVKNHSKNNKKDIYYK